MYVYVYVCDTVVHDDIEFMCSLVTFSRSGINSDTH